MKKSYIFIILLIACPVAALYYYWQQATKLPDWYTSKSANGVQLPSQSLSHIRRTKAEIERELIKAAKDSQKTGNPEQAKIELSDKDINEIVISEIAATNNSTQLPESIKGVNTTIKDGSIETGAVVNLSQVPPDRFGEKGKAALTKLTKTFPYLKSREVYIGVSGKPAIKDGKIRFNEDTKIKLGNVSLTVNELANKIGIPKEQLERKLNFGLNLSKVKVEDIELVDNKARIKGTPN